MMKMFKLQSEQFTGVAYQWTFIASSFSSCKTVMNFNFDSCTVDKGATDHMTRHLYLLTSVINLLPELLMICLLNGTTKPIYTIGKIVLNPWLDLNDILHVPDFAHNLLLVSKALKHNHLFITCNQYYCIF